MIAASKITVQDWSHVVWHLRIDDTRTLEQRAIERWENEGGEIPNEQRKQTNFANGKSLHPSTFD
jgi:hypothetical protein